MRRLADATQCERHLTIPFNSYLWDGKSTKKSGRGVLLSFLAAPGFSVFAVNIEAFSSVPDTMCGPDCARSCGAAKW